jgi:hypothetical protein
MLSAPTASLQPSVPRRIDTLAEEPGPTTDGHLLAAAARAHPAVPTTHLIVSPATIQPLKAIGAPFTVAILTWMPPFLQKRLQGSFQQPHSLTYLPVPIANRPRNDGAGGAARRPVLEA